MESVFYFVIHAENIDHLQHQNLSAHLQFKHNHSSTKFESLTLNSSSNKKHPNNQHSKPLLYLYKMRPITYKKESFATS